jgi:hypothetical protein
LLADLERRQPQPQLSQELMMQMADAVGEMTGATERRLRDQIDDLREQLALIRTELTVTRAAMNGKVTLIGGARDVA